MNTTIDHITVAPPPADAQPLPEAIGASGLLLFTADALSAAVTVAVVGTLLRSPISAFFTVAFIIFIASAIGRYRVSYAVTERDEWYAATAVALPSMAAGAILAGVLGFSIWPALLAAVPWVGLSGLAAVRLHRLRRNGASFAGILPRIRTAPRTPVHDIEEALIRALDVIIGSIALVVLLPVLLAVALIVVIDDGGPAIFAQRRVGRDDRDFSMYKVRTMRRNADAAWVAESADERITRVGRTLRRTSLDELPQLLNVVRGDMSLVGPRPEMQEYASRFNRDVENYWQRHRLRPGITGWAQLYLPRTLTPQDAPVVLAYDLFYVEHVGLYLYLQCIVKTAAEIFMHRAL